MGTVESITNRLKAERHNVTVQARISAEHSELLDDFVDWLNNKGAETNRSAAVRALVLDGLEAFRDFRDEEQLKTKSRADV